MIEKEKLYLVNEVSEFLRCKRTNVYDLATNGELVCIKVGARNGGIRFMGSDILDFLEKRRLVKTEPGKKPSLAKPPKKQFSHLAKYLT